MPKKKRNLYYIGLHSGLCGLMAARDIRQARKKALRENGTNNLAEVRRATKEDIEHIAAMGGWIPDDAS